MMRLPMIGALGRKWVEGGGVGLDTGRVAMYLEGPWVDATLARRVGDHRRRDQLRGH